LPYSKYLFKGETALTMRALIWTRNGWVKTNDIANWESKF